MSVTRPLGVTLVAIYLFAKAAVLILAATIVHMRSGLWPGANDFISTFAFSLGVSLPLISALLNATVGLGIWFLKRWSRTIIIAINSYLLCKMAFGSLILMQLDRKFLLSHTSSPYFVISLVAAVVVLLYLLDSDVKRAFGVPDGQFD